jgi:hypothetical protein
MNVSYSADAFCFMASSWIVLDRHPALDDVEIQSQHAGAAAELSPQCGHLLSTVQPVYLVVGRL